LIHVNWQQTFTQVLYRLLANPEYIEPLRQEVDEVIKEEGWTKAGIDKMHKIDSFLRETQRIDGLGLCSLDSFTYVQIVRRRIRILMCVSCFPVAGLGRLALRPFTFSNGVTVPAGTLVSIPAGTIHTDERIYPNPDEFDGFRFAKLRKSEEDTMTNRYQTVSTSSEHLTFGIGRHTW
jgi:cytochrome P450